MRVLIIGAGAVGLGLAAFLLNSSSDIVFLARRNTADSLRERGFAINGIFGSFKYKGGNFAVINDYNSIDKNFDYILITAKTYANREIASKLCSIKPYIKNAKIVVIQNGWGNSEAYLDCFGKNSVFTSRIISGFYRKTPSEVEITVHADAMVIGSIFKKEISGSTADLVNALNAGGFEAAVSEDVDKHLWAKMLYNCALNPLGAILDVEYGRLLKNKNAEKIMDTIIGEIYNVMKLSGYSTFYETADNYKKIFYSKLIPSTRSHRSSMLQDLRNKRKTEIDSLNGIVVNLAKKHKMETPYNKFIVDIIKSFENMFYNGPAF